MKIVSFHMCANIQEHLESKINSNVRIWNLGHSYFKQVSLCNDQYIVTHVIGISVVDFISVSTRMWAHF